MSEPLTVKLIVERISKNKLSKADEYRREIAAAANKRANAPGVVGKATKMRGPFEELDDNDNQVVRYEFTVILTKSTYKQEEAARKHLEAARKFVERAAEARGWKVKGEKAEVQEIAAAADARPDFNVPELTEEIKSTYFNGLKERDAHLRMIYTSVTTLRETKNEERNHILLYGDSSSAKSSVIKGFKEWFDSIDGVERVMHVNATTLSKSGLENLLLERAQNKMLPEILWINEIEKGISSDFLCLLSIMDGLGSISRLNSRIGKQEAKCEILVVADCNNADVIKGWASGALWSRFVKKLPCVRPSRDVMTEILSDIIENRRKKGYPANQKWVKAAINYAFDVVKNNDPRFVKSLLEGKDGLLDGSYFKDLEQIELAFQISESAKIKN